MHAHQLAHSSPSSRLVLASIKLNTPEVGKGIAEDWLSGRADGEGVIEGGEGYEKIIELYCLHVRSSAFGRVESRCRVPLIQRRDNY